MHKIKPIEIRQPTDNAAVDLAIDTLERKKQALVFVNTKRGAEKAAEDIAAKTNLTDEKYKKDVSEISDDILHALSKPTRQCERLARCVKKGIAFHHAGLTHDQKTLIEDAFREGKIKIICATSTLAYGLNLPAFRAIIRDLKRFGHYGLDWIPTLDYHQMAGRCGRPGFDSWGEAIAVAASEKEKDELIDRYINGESEEIYSKLAVEPVLRTYVLSLIASGFASSEEELVEFFSRTFWAHHYKDTAKLRKIIDRMIDLLDDFGFIGSGSSRQKKKESEKYEEKDGTKDDFVSADEIEKEDKEKKGKISATTVGKRVAELYIDPLTAHNMLIAMERASEKTVSEFSFMHLVSTCMELRPLLRVKQSEYDDIQEKAVEYHSNTIALEPSEFDPDHGQFMDAVKTALFFGEWMDEKDEEAMLEKYNIRPGEIRVKLDLADWLLYAAEELARLDRKQKLISTIIKTRLRMRYGVKEELLPLLKLKGIGRMRARKLFSNGIKDIGDVSKADVTTLAHIIGKNIAFDIKKQVGQDMGKVIVPERKRKGQISLKDFGEK